MYINRSKEKKNTEKVKLAWIISKKYSQILMDHEDTNEHLIMYMNIHKLFLSELQNRKINNTIKKNYIQCWNTVLNTLLKDNPVKLQRRAIKLLHQTSIQRVEKYSTK